MTKRRPADAEPVSAEPKKRASSTKPRASAATHKHTSKKALDVSLSEPARTVSHEEISLRAYSYWEARGYQDGDAEQDWLQAEKDLLELAKNS